MAQSYRDAAAAYRSAAAKSCPADVGCYNANAAYYDCLAAQLGPGNTRCSAPSCSTGHCTGAAGGSGLPGAAPKGNSTVASINSLSNALVGLIQASENARAQRDQAQLAQALQVWELERQRADEARAHMAQVNQNLAALVEEDKAALAQETKAVAEARATLISNQAAQQKTVLVRIGQRVVDPGPATGDPQCGPWMSLKDRDGNFFNGLDIAICGVDSMLPGDPRDLPTWWMVRNTTGSPVDLDLEVGVQCISACTSGYYGFKVSVAPSKVFSNQVRGGCWSIFDYRVLTAKEGKR